MSFVKKKPLTPFRAVEPMIPQARPVEGEVMRQALAQVRRVHGPNAERSIHNPKGREVDLYSDYTLEDHAH